MQTLKPECGACGNNNPLDSDYCLECGIRLTHKETLAEGMELFLDDLPKETVSIVNKYTGISYKCEHKTTIGNLQCECVRCINCDKRTETCFKHSPKFDYTLQTHKKNSLDHLREIIEEEKNTPFPIDKKLDFRSMQIPDWHLEGECTIEDCITPLEHDGYKKGQDRGHMIEKQVEETFKEGFEKCDYKDCLNKEPHGKWHIPIISQPPYSAITGTDVRRGGINNEQGLRLNRPIPIRHVGGRKRKCDCDGIKFTCDEFRRKKALEKLDNTVGARPYSPITKRDVRKGIGKPDIKTQIEQAQTWPDKMIAKTYIPLQKPEPRQISILDIGEDTSIKLGSTPRKRPKKQNPTEYITIRKNFNSKLLWLIPITIWSLWIYLVFNL